MDDGILKAIRRAAPAREAAAGSNMRVRRPDGTLVEHVEHHA